MKNRLPTIMSLMLCIAILLLGCVKHPAVPYDVYNGTIRTQQGVYINTQTNILTFGEDAVLAYNNTETPLGTVMYDLSRCSDGDKLYYHLDSQKIYSYDAHKSVYLGTYHNPAFFTELNMDQPLLFVDGKSAAKLSELKDMTIACLGDSMTSGSNKVPGYPQFLPQLLGAKTVLNYGLSGSGITQPPYSSAATAMSIRYCLIDESADIIIVLGCVNDWSDGSIELGNSSDVGTFSFCAHFRAMCQGLKERYPNAQIYVFSSPESNPANKSAQNLTGTQWEGNTEGYNRIGKQLKDYAKAMETICAEEDIPFCSLTELLSWEVFDGDTEYTTSEKVLMIADAIAEFIKESYAS